MGIDDISRAIGIGARLRRQELDLTQSDVASRCGVTRQHVAMIENQRSGVTVEMLVLLASALETTPTHLMGKYADRAWKIKRIGPGAKNPH